ncbi:MAG: DNA polymerase III subunit delta' [Chloroflexi bacterium]|nr:DNA polymerase III subunit delta' [Chloroflexota bacterium]
MVRLLERSLDEGRLAHSYLLAGPPHVGKMTLALHLAQAVNCTGSPRPCQQCRQCQRVAALKHTDVQVMGLPEAPARDISIDQVRELQRAAALKPFEGSCRVFIIEGAERLSQDANNALLKTLEEPPPQVLLLLITTDEEAILPTVRSRCQRLELHPLALLEVAEALQERGLGPEEARRLAWRSQGCPGVALSALEDPEGLTAQDEELEELLTWTRATLHQRFAYAADLAQRFSDDREKVQALLGLWAEGWRDLVLLKEGAPEYVVHQALIPALAPLAKELETDAVVQAVRLAQETLELLDRNVNPRVALEHLLLGLPTLPPGPAGTPDDT